MEGYHKTVLLNEAIEVLVIRDAWFLDCTLGDGGHSLEIIGRGGKVVGVDVDPEALGRVQKRFEQLGIGKDRYKLIQGNFRDIKNLIQKQTNLPADATHQALQAGTVDLKIAGAIFDLGVSSLQLESSKRGFSFGKDGPLDMRMDPTLAIAALDIVNNFSGKELYEIFKQLGEEKYSKRVADAIVRAREVRQFSSTLGLAGVIERVLGRQGHIHPATKVFQALRIFVNDELGALKEGLVEVFDLIENRGVMSVISFHSLEDRIVKNVFKDWQDLGFGEVITKKPIVPGEQEVAENPRSRSAKLRIFKKI